MARIGISAEEASKILGISRTRVYQLIHSGKIKLEKDGSISKKSVMARKKAEPDKGGRPYGTFKNIGGNK